MPLVAVRASSAIPGGISPRPPGSAFGSIAAPANSFGSTSGSHQRRPYSTGPDRSGTSSVPFAGSISGAAPVTDAGMAWLGTQGSALAGTVIRADRSVAGTVGPISAPSRR